MELNAHPFFKQAGDSQITGLIEVVEQLDYEAGEVIFDEGSLSDGIYLVLEGRIAFTKELPGKRKRIISYSKEGEFFGEISMFTGQVRALGAEADQDVRIAKLPSEKLIRLFRDTPGPVEQILKSIIQHLNDTTEHYVNEMLHQERMSVVGSMANTIMHDFKNPFTTISLAAQILEQRHADDEYTLKMCQRIENQINTMVAMASEISEFSKGKHHLVLRTLSLKDMFNTFRDNNDPFFRDSHISITIEADDTTLEGEQTKLLRVLQNLVGNAIEAIPEGKEGIINIRGEDKGDHVLISIKDNGEGIPKEIHETFFEPFVTFGKSGGTGLGTAIVKSLTEAHGGTVTFETEMGKGTTFSITLPKTHD